ncbi:MAG: prolipoprotein diacylglyceryl transferase [Phycisphaerales bacterium JB063]
MPLLLADAWLHNLDPFAIQLDWFPGGGLRWYGLSYLVGFALGYFLVRRVVTAGVSPLSPKQVADFIVTLAIGIVIGGRLGYVLFYQPGLIVEFTGDAPFWGVFAINNGGMASHGGIVGGMLGCVFFAWRQKIPLLHAMDLMAFGGPIGLLFGRLANFVNGELYGRACAADFPLAVKFPQEMGDWLPQRLSDGTVTGGDPKLIELEAGVREAVGYVPTSAYDLVEFAIQKVQAGDASISAVVEPLLTPRYPSQLFAGLTEGLVVMAVLLIVYRRPVRPGLVGGVFGISYALMRVLNEFFRMPDAHLMVDGNIPDITRGQWLSFALLFTGIAVVTVALEQQREKLGGWLGGE